MKIVALDPGGTTGVSIFDSQGQAPTAIAGKDLHLFFTMRQLTGEHHYSLWDMLEVGRPHTVIYERFMYQRRELDQGVSLVLDSLEYIGVTKLWYQSMAERHDMGHEAAFTPELVCQTPAQAKNLWTDDKLKTLELYSKGAPHANDATRHLLYYLLVNRNCRQILDPLKPT